MSLSRKRQKELRKLQDQANSLWESQQVILNEVGTVAREAGRQLDNYRKEQVVPTVAATYDKYAAPYVERSATVSRKFLNGKVVPAAGAVVGSALSVWDAASDTRSKLAAGRGFVAPDLAAYSKKADRYGKDTSRKLAAQLAILEPKPKKKSIGAGGVIALILGAAAAIGVVYAAWQTLRADDELWVADDPLAAPDA